MLTFGEPGYLSGPADPNWYIRWDAMEMTYNGVASDYGDIQTINGYAIPLQVQNFTTGTTTPLQTVRRTILTYPTPTVLAQLKGPGRCEHRQWLQLHARHRHPERLVRHGHDDPAQFPAPDLGRLRAVGAATVPPVPSVLGPYPSFNAYVDYIQAQGVSTPLSDTVSGVTFNFNATAATSGADSAIILTGTVTGPGSIGANHTLTMTVPPDTNVGHHDRQLPV